MGKKFSDEIEYIPQALAWALEQDVTLLTRSLAGLSGKNLISIGSGGSSTVAAFIASLHESNFGLVSRSITPGEFLAHQHILENSCAALISAEGKNLDILAAADRVASLEMPGLALVLKAQSPLEVQCRATGTTTVTSFQMPWGKDGYLATNSLLATMVLASRAYGSQGVEQIKKVDRTWLTQRRAYIANQCLAEHMSSRKSLAVLYGAVGRIGAVDIESKLSESALGTCELTDYRQFAHGRHLQLAKSQNAPCFFAFYSSKDRALCDSTLALFPPEIPVIKMALPDDPIEASLLSVIDAILVIDILGQDQQCDPGQPPVTNFGRRLHVLNIKELLPPPKFQPAPLWRKLRDGANHVNQTRAWSTAAMEFCERLANARPKALVCDFDGTFCDTDLRFDGLDTRLISAIERLTSGGTIIGFASGRGGSLYDDLRKKLNPAIWSNIIVGYYSGSLIAPLNVPEFIAPPTDPRFEQLEQWLVDIGILLDRESKPNKHGGQMSLRRQHYGYKHRAVAGIRNWIKQENHLGWRVFCSGHSIDVLTENVGKEQVIQAIAKHVGCNPNTEILKIGDSGDFDGNDFELLNSGLSLSVDGVSPFRHACWNLLPRGCKGVAGTLYYLNSLEYDDHSLRFSPESICRIRATLEIGDRRP